MIDSATVATITMAVPAESPPIKASIASMFCPADKGRASMNMSASTPPAGKRVNPAMVIGTTNRLIATR